MSCIGVPRESDVNLLTSLIHQCITRSKLAILNIVRKLINTNENTDKNIPSINCSKFYRRKYFIGIHWKNYNGKKIKWSQKIRWHVIYINKITDGINFIGKIISKLLTMFIMSSTKRITNGKFCWYLLESSGIIYFPIVLLINILYR